jgi:hypothetical protein
MRPWLVAVLLALLALPAAAQAAPSEGCVQDGSDGTLQRWTCTTAPITVPGLSVRQSGSGADDLRGTPRPPVDGSITSMDVDVVGADGRQVPIRRLMLHHIVFANLGAQLGEKADATCGRFTMLDSRTTIPAIGERFYGAGEERAGWRCRPATDCPRRRRTAGTSRGCS